MLEVGTEAKEEDHDVLWCWSDADPFSSRCEAPLPSPSSAASAWPWSCGQAPGVMTLWPSSGSLCVTWPQLGPPPSTWAEPPASWWSLLRTRAWRRTRSSSEKGELVRKEYRLGNCAHVRLVWFTERLIEGFSYTHRSLPGVISM